MLYGTDTWAVNEQDLCRFILAEAKIWLDTSATQTRMMVYPSHVVVFERMVGCRMKTCMRKMWSAGRQEQTNKNLAGRYEKLLESQEPEHRGC